jgi:hypothetical protein
MQIAIVLDSGADRPAGIDLGLWLAGELAGREQAETIELHVEYDPQPLFDAGHASKASKTVVGLS